MYKDGEHIPLLVNKVYSDNTQLQFPYYDLPFVCPPTGTVHPGSNFMSGQSRSLNLGEVLRGDRIVTSDIDIVMGRDQECQMLCTQNVTRRDVSRARDLIQDGYVAEWILDNLPGATSFVSADKTRKYYAAGFKMGHKDFSPSTGKPRYYINNHITIVIRWRKVDGRPGRNGYKYVIGFEVYTKSIGEADRTSSGCPKDSHDDSEGMELYIPPKGSFSKLSSHDPDEEEDFDDGETLQIPYSYSVYYRMDDTIPWDHRWDLYFVNQEEGSKIHWLAIINSLIICGLLTAIVGMILARTVRSDIKGSNPEAGKSKNRRKARSAGSRTPRGEKKGGLLEQPGDLDNDADVSSDEELLEDAAGWKLLHGDVFRAPKHAIVLAPLIGSGMQLVFMVFGLLFLSSLGILNPSFRGGFVSVGFGLFIFAGIFSGYFSGRVYKTFGGQNWRQNILITATLCPGVLFVTIFILNLFVWAQASSTAIPLTTLIALAFMWLCIQGPLVYFGHFYGFEKSPVWEHPTRTTAIPRQIPMQPWYIRPVRSVLLAGLIPFAVIFIELLFVFQSVWQDKSGYYYVFGFLSLIFTILLVTICEVTIVTIYICLAHENYNWWWHSFFVGAGSSVWIFLYCVWYYTFKLQIQGFISAILFFAYCLLGCTVYGLLCGTVGFLTAFAFVRKIYRYDILLCYGPHLASIDANIPNSAIKAD